MSAKSMPRVSSVQARLPSSHVHSNIVESTKCNYGIASDVQAAFEGVSCAEAGFGRPFSSLSRELLNARVLAAAAGSIWLARAATPQSTDGGWRSDTAPSRSTACVLGPTGIAPAQTRFRVRGQRSRGVGGGTRNAGRRVVFDCQRGTGRRGERSPVPGNPPEATVGRACCVQLGHAASQDEPEESEGSLIGLINREESRR
jgi:hypothetical protein